MNELPRSDTRPADSTQHDLGVDRGRRRLGAAGVAGTAVLLSLPSRSAMAQTESGTGSESMSGNLSTKLGAASACGRSPGFWWNDDGSSLRCAPSLAAYPFTSMFNEVFGGDLLVTDASFQDLDPRKPTPAYTKPAPTGTANHAIAALLNAAYYGKRYPVSRMQTPNEVLAEFKLAFERQTPYGQPNNDALSDFVRRVNVYKKGV